MAFTRTLQTAEQRKAKKAARNRAWWARNHAKRAAYSAAWRKRNPDKVREAKRADYAAHTDRVKEGMRRSRMRCRYGISTEAYDELLAEQGGVCAMCGKPPRKKRLCVDHDHATGMIRGLLCVHCNVVIGVIERFGKAADRYLTHGV